MMEIFIESSSQGNLYDGNPSPFPSFGHIGAPYVDTLSLPRFMISLLIWMFSTSLVSNVQTTPQLSPPHNKREPQVDD